MRFLQNSEVNYEVKNLIFLKKRFDSEEFFYITRYFLCRKPGAGMIMLLIIT